ncbi:MAG: radical SAM protein [Ruminococcaceae bacterium]|nr:radical SAM protein [Oscillospiraceae bacterium]
MTHKNIAVFVAHEGCPNECSFCNQHIISGKQETASAADVQSAVETALKSGCFDGQLAFFGGSFTAIDRFYMLELLTAAKPFYEKGQISGIRISTRPDAIDEKILKILKEYGVKAIELGAQSMDDNVLFLNKRGHTADDVRVASKLIKEYDFELGLQMMTGLFGDTDKGALFTADEIIKLNPETVRIYPTVVLEGTELCRLYRAGKYQPQTIDDAVLLCGKLLLKFHKANIKVIRLGLHSGGNVEEGFVAGVYHPAFRELVEGQIYLDLILSRLKEKGEYKIFVNPKEISKMVGQNRKNIVQLKDNNYICKVFSDKSLGKYEINIEVDE